MSRGQKLDIEINPTHKSYQSFSSESDSNSHSSEKLMKLGIPEGLKGKIVLDIGCNEGFFCFECEKRGAKVIGIEREKKWYDLALKRKNILSSFVNFINDDWNCILLLNYKFDLVLFLARRCLSEPTGRRILRIDSRQPAQQAFRSGTGSRIV